MKQFEQVNKLSLFENGGVLGKQIAGFNWAGHPIGEIQKWPQSLLSAAGICLNSNFPIAIYWGNDLHLIYNDAWSPIPGSKHPWALGRPAREVWPDIWTDIEPLFKEAISTGKATGSKDALLPMKRYGYVEECYFDFTFTPIYGESGKVDGIFNAVIETTYRVINERRAAFIRRFSASLNSAKNPDELFDILRAELTNEVQDIPFSGYFIKKETGWEQSFLVHASENPEAPNFFTCIPDLLNPFHFQNIKNSFFLDIESPWPEEVEDACYIPVLFNGELHGGFILGVSSRLEFNDEYLKFFQEMANLLAGELQTREALTLQRKRADELEALDKAKTVFFSNISHEFRTPITLMLGPLEEELNKPGSTLADSTTQNLETAHRNAMRLLKLVNSLLDFSRIESGRQKANYVLTDVVALTKQLAGNFQSVIEKGGLQFLVKADAYVAPVYLDKDMWEKIVFNLLSNAFKYTLHGTITITVFEHDQHAVLKVADTGTGIPAQELKNLFQRFHRIQNASGRTFEGTGIGLSMIKELVHLMGGDISVESEEGKGTAFTVKIPFGKAHISTEQIRDDNSESGYFVSNTYIDEAYSLLEKRPAGSSPDTEAPGKPLILVVDDNADMREHLASILQNEYNVRTAANGMEALHKLKEIKPDLVLTDVMMPILNGIDLLKQIKEHPPTSGIPVIILTARAGEESKIEGYETGADDYLVKPFSSRELLARIKTQIKVTHSRRHAEQNLYHAFQQAPVAIAIYKGRELVCEFANDPYLQMMGKTNETLIGSPMFQSFPQLKEAFHAAAMNLLHTGETFPRREFEVNLERNGQTERCYFNSIWAPLRDEFSNITGMICCVEEVTAQVLTKKTAPYTTPENKEGKPANPST